jgi:transposase
LSDLIEELAERGGDTPSREALVTVLQMVQKVIDEQAIEIQYLRKQLFGRRSEKVSTGQLSLFVQALAALAEQAEPKENAPEGAAPPSPPPKPKKKNKQKRRPLRPTRTEEIPVPAEDRPCPECGADRCTLGHVRSLVVEYTPPKIEVIEYLREKIVCRPCEGEISIAPPPKERVIDRALPGPNMLSALVVNKCVDGLPLQRSRKIFKRAGLDIPIGTLNRWEGFAHQLLEPLINLIKARVLSADTINLDDTGIRVRDPTVPEGVWSGHIWVFIGRKYDPGGDLEKTEEFVSYLYAPTWEARHPEAFLKGCTAVIQGDAYRGYERIASPNRGDQIGKLLAGCCMHTRRPFVQAFESQLPGAAFFVERFQQIYRIEAKAKEQKLTAEARLALRIEESMPIMRELHDRAKELSDLPLLKPMKTGVTYFVNQWEKLIVPFTKDGRLEIDNGSAERRLRRVASGRKAWLFAGSHGGAERFADVLSLVSTADAAGADAGSYLPSVISAVDSWPQSRIGELLPHRWRAALEESLREKAAQ